MSRHKLFLDSETQVGKNRITLPSALADYYGNSATAYVCGRQVESKTITTGGLTGNGVDSYVSFASAISCDRIIIRGNFYGISTTQYFIGSSDYAQAVGIHYNGSTILFDGAEVGTGTISWIAPDLVVEMDFRMNNTSPYDWDLYVDGTYVGEFTDVGSINILNLFRQREGYYFGNKLTYLKTIYNGSTTFESNFVKGVSATTLYDESGNGNHGTLNNFDTSTCWETPYTEFICTTPTKEIEIGRGNLDLGSVEPDTENRNVLSFDGTNDYMTLPFLVEPFTSYEFEMTISAETTDDEQVLLEQRSGGNSPSGFNLGILLHDWTNGDGTFDDLDFLFPGYNTGTALEPASSGILNSGFYNLKYIKDTSDSKMKIYIDDALFAFKDISDTNFTKKGTLYFGRDYINARYFKGNLAKLKITEAGIVIADYDFVSSYGDSTLTDVSGNENHASITGATWTTDDVPIPIKTQEVLHWSPSSDIGCYWVLTEDAGGNQVYVKVAGTWKEGVLYLKTPSSGWVQASDVNIRTTDGWK